MKMVEAAEMEMVFLSILCDILKNSEYADIIAKSLKVWQSAAESLISGYAVARTKDFETGPTNTIISHFKNRMLWWK